MTTQIILLIITVLLFSMGLWPIAFLTTGSLIAVSILKHENKKKTEKEEIEQLKRRIADLEREKHIEEIIRKSEKKEGEK